MENMEREHASIQELETKVTMLSREIDAAKIILEQIAKLHTEGTFEEAVESILASVGACINAERMYIFEDRGERYPNTYEWCAEGIRPEKDSLQDLTKEEVAPWTNVLRNGEHIYIPDVEKIKESMPDIYRILSRQNITSVVEAPIMSGERLIGFLGVDNAPEEISNIIIGSLITLGTFLGMTMQIREEQKKIQSQNLRLAQERKRYRDALSNKCAFCYLFDLDDGYLYEDFTTARGENLIQELGLSLPVHFDEFNQAYITHYGIDILNDDSERHFTCQGLLNDYDRGETNISSEYYCRLTDRYYRVVALLSRDELNGHVYAVVIATDTTEVTRKENKQLHELKEARRRLKDANEKINLQLKTVFGGINGGLKVSRDDEDFSFEYVSDRVASIQGYTPEEFMKASGGSAGMNCIPEDREETKRILKRQYEKGDTYYLKYRVRHKDGSIRWIIDSGRRVVEADGEVRHYSLIQDVTEQEGKNIALRDAYDMQAQMLDAICCGVFAYKVPEYELILANDIAKRLIKCEDGEDEMESFGRFYTQYIVEEDRALVDGMKDVLKKPGDSAQYVFRVRGPGGALEIISCITKRLRYINGQEYILSSLQDITERTNLEMMLSTERSEYRDALLDSAQFSFAMDLTEGYLTESIHTKEGDIPLEKYGMKPPVWYDDILDKWIGQREIIPLEGNMEMILHRGRLLDRYWNGDTRVEAEYCSKVYKEYYNVLVLLSRNQMDHHIHAIFIVHNVTEARKAEQRQKRKLLEAKENLSAMNEELRASLDSEREKTAIISAMSNVYYGNYLIDLRDESIMPIAGVEYLEEIGTRGRNVKDVIQFWITNIVHESFRKDMEKFTDLSTISERMRETQILSEECISLKVGWIRVSFIVVSRSEADEVQQMLWVAQHIAAEKQRELEQKEALRTAYDAASRANSAKTQFLANMSHDIRTPMNAIIGMTAIAGTHLDDRERVADCLGKITISSKHLLGLINEVLDMSKIESGKIELHEEAFSLPELIDNLLIMVKPQVKAKNHELSVTIRGIEHEMVVGDSQRIQQSFMNLMSNAVKYTPDGGKIALTITERPMNKPHLGCYEFIFEDNGIGMSEDFLRHFFDPFARAADSRVEKIQGTGLGMAITKNIVQMMNGNIKVESELDKGTKITVTIVMKLQNQEEKIAYDEFIDLPILVADDDALACETTCEMLDELGMNGEWVTSGQEAVDYVVLRHEEGNDFFAVIIDWKMPDMDGLQTTKEIRRRVGKDVPIIIISAYDWSDIELEARAAGANAFISKPLFKSRVAHVFNSLLSHGQSGEEYLSMEKVVRNDFTGRRALLVEDNDLNAEIAGEILKMAGLDVEFARDGKEALDIMTTAKDDYYDIVFMDIQMPVMNGYDATTAIRALPRNYTKRVPIIAMTANAFAEDVQASRNAGMNQHMAKPIDIKQLMEVLHHWIH